MKRYEMIKDKSLFNNIIKNGHYRKNKLFVVYEINNEDEKIKFGIAISKKVGKAVIRNKLKRQTRAIIDNNRNLFKNVNNYIIMIRRSCNESNFFEMNEALQSLMKEIKVKK